jgi:hypothetical protein
MKELILQTHGQTTPNTFRNGTDPIDGIFGTPGIEVLNCGYTSGNWGTPSDHRAVWIDIDVVSTFGGYRHHYGNPESAVLN